MTRVDGECGSEQPLTAACHALASAADALFTAADDMADSPTRALLDSLAIAITSFSAAVRDIAAVLPAAGRASTADGGCEASPAPQMPKDAA
jgi:hypothetical protein